MDIPGGTGTDGHREDGPVGGEPLRGVVPGAQFVSLPGVERVRAWARGTAPLPPLCHLIGLRVSQVEPASVTVTMPGSPWLINGVDVLVALDLLSVAATEIAGMTAVDAASRARLVALNAQAMRMARAADGPFSARGTVIHAGRTFVRVATSVQDALGRVVGHAIGALAVEPEGAPAAAHDIAAIPLRYSGPDPSERPFPGAGFPMRSWDTHEPLEVFRAISTGELPTPNLNRLLGIQLLDGTEGSVTVAIPASMWFALQDETVDPTILNAVSAFSSGAAVMTLGSRDRIGGEVNRAIAFERKIPADGRTIIARATTRLQGARIMVCDVEITDPDGNIAALEQALWLLVKRREDGAVSPESERKLATVLFTDIVASTERASALGDARWREELEGHHAVVRQQLQIFRGHEVKTTGDGFLATFDSPARAVQCARAIRDRIQPSGLQIRAGLHAGELEATNDDIAGIAVHIASRILATCAPSEILVSSTIRDLTAGSGLRLEDRGAHNLKGLDHEWELFAVRD
jgi:class 3 adenylate cyclase